MSNKEIFLELVSSADIKSVEKIKWRIANREWLRESQKIAFKVLEKLDKLGWSQKDLAEKMNVSPQYINKIVKGSENLTLETQIKLQNVLDIPILASYYENQFKVMQELIVTFKEIGKYLVSKPIEPNYNTGKIVRMEPNTFSYNCSYQA